MKNCMKIKNRGIPPIPHSAGETLPRLWTFAVQLAWMVGSLLMLTTMLPGMGSQVWANTVARIVPEKQRIEIGRDNGRFMLTSILSLYEEQHIQYFSAGVGLDERNATYPPFSLKCVFVSGLKTFLAHVRVDIRDQNGEVVLTISNERVSGPWLFVDLPKGKYSLTATRGDGTEVARKVTVGGGQPKVVHFRWPHS